MKLANMEPLTGTFVERLDEMDHKKEELDEDHCAGNRDEMDEVMHVPGERDEEPGGRDMYEAEEVEVDVDEADVEVDAEADDMDVDVEVDVAPAVEAAVEDVVGQLMAAVKDVLVANEMGDLLDIEMDDEDAAEDAEEAAADDAAAAGDMAAAGEMMAADAMDLEENVEIVEEDEMINEVAKRVTARLVKAMADKN
jgi:hypothetical protein